MDSSTTLVTASPAPPANATWIATRISVPTAHRNLGNRGTALLFHLGSLNLYPVCPLPTRLGDEPNEHSAEEIPQLLSQIRNGSNLARRPQKRLSDRPSIPTRISTNHEVSYEALHEALHAVIYEVLHAAIHAVIYERRSTR